LLEISGFFRIQQRGHVQRQNLKGVFCLEQSRFMSVEIETEIKIVISIFFLVSGFDNIEIKIDARRFVVNSKGSGQIQRNSEIHVC
jgi:hypothetical protein